MRGVESGYINRIDKTNVPPEREVGDQGLAAEEVILNFFQTIPGVTIRRSTKQEDSSLKQITKDLAIDGVVYSDERPGLGLQATTTTDYTTREQKYKADLLDRPFMRLPEMKTTDVSIPRVLIFLDAVEVAKFVKDPVIEHHPSLGQQIIESSLNSLKLDLLKTKNPREIELVEKWMVLLNQTRQLLSDKKSGKPN